jgi:hypothetical protein
MALQLIVEPWPRFQLLGTIHSRGNNPRKASAYTRHNTSTSMPVVRLQPTNSAVEWAKTVHATDHASTVISRRTRLIDTYTNIHSVSSTFAWQFFVSILLLHRIRVVLCLSNFVLADLEYLKIIIKAIFFFLSAPKLTSWSPHVDEAVYLPLPA